MRPRPTLASAALLLVALAHGLAALRMLADGVSLAGGAQLVCTGALVLAGVAVTSRRTFSTALAIAAGATLVRVLGNGAVGPFLPPNVALIAGFALAAWAARSLDGPAPSPWAGVALRGGFLLVACAYATFATLTVLRGGAQFVVADLATRALASLVVALVVDAPGAPARERKAFGGGAPMRDA